MPEPFTTIWLIFIGAGGYVLAVVQFFKDFLNVKKLELEIAELREKVRTRESVVHRATAEEIEKYGRLIERSRYRSSAPLLLMPILGIGIGLVMATAYITGSRDSNELHMALGEIQASHARINELESHLVMLEKKLVESERKLKKQEEELDLMRKSLKDSAAQQGAAGDAPKAARP